MADYKVIDKGFFPVDGDGKTCRIYREGETFTNKKSGLKGAWFEEVKKPGRKPKAEASIESLLDS